MKSVQSFGKSVLRSRGQIWAGLLLLLVVAAQACGQAVVSTDKTAGGDNHTLVIMADGSVKAWGQNSSGQLGLGFVSSHVPAPTTIPGLSGVVAVTAGANFSMARLSNGTVMAWGQNNYGQLGTGNTTLSSIPVAIPGLTDVVELSAGGYHGLARLAGGAVKSWGRNNYGQLGQGDYVDRSSPLTVPGVAGLFSSVVAIEAGGYHNFARLANGNLKGWGYNYYGQLGDGTATNRPAPIAIASISDLVDIKAAAFHSAALLPNGNVKTWGQNISHQLGIGLNVAMNPLPYLVPGISSAVALEADGLHNFAKLADGTIKAWGVNTGGQLGVGHTTLTSTPLTVPGLTNVDDLTVCGYISLALLLDGTVQTWGPNTQGQLGLGHLVNQSLPQTVPCLNLNGASFPYSFQIGAIGSTAVGCTIPCSSELGALTGTHYYANVYSLDPLNATNQGAGSWYGLHIAQPELLAWAELAASGHPLVFGALGVNGAAASIPVPPSALSGLTVYGVSIAINPLTNLVVADSNIAANTF